MHVKRVVSFDDAETDVAALLALLCDLHTQLNAAGVPPDGTLSERMKLALERTEQAWLAARIFEKAFDEAEADRRAATAAARCWKAAAKTFRRRWRDSCAELADGRKPIYRLIEWLQAVHLYPTDVFETSDHYTFYASFEEPIAGTILRALTGMNLKVETTPIRNRYMIQFVPSPDDEV